MTAMRIKKYPRAAIERKMTLQESILPNFDFSGFPIFGVKLESL